MPVFITTRCIDGVMELRRS